MNKELKDWENELKLPEEPKPIKIIRPWHKFLPLLAMLAKGLASYITRNKPSRRDEL